MVAGKRGGLVRLLGEVGRELVDFVEEGLGVSLLVGGVGLGNGSGVFVLWEAPARRTGLNRGWWVCFGGFRWVSCILFGG